MMFTIFNVPGPTGQLTLMGCEVTRGYPAVALATGHRVSIGMTSVNDMACFGVFADAERASDADRLARQTGAAIDELLARCGNADTTARTARTNKVHQGWQNIQTANKPRPRAPEREQPAGGAAQVQHAPAGRQDRCRARPTPFSKRAYSAALASESSLSVDT